MNMPTFHAIPTSTRKPRSTSRGGLRTAAVLAIFALAGAGCAEVVDVAQETVDQAQETVERTQFCVAAARVAQAMQAQDFEAAVSAGEDMVAHAPQEVAGPAQFLLDAAREAQAGDDSALRSQEGRDAADTVARYTQDRCDPR